MGWARGAAGALVSVLMLSGCPGTLDPTLFPTSGAGGNHGERPAPAALPTAPGQLDGATIVMSPVRHLGLPRRGRRECPSAPAST